MTGPRHAKTCLRACAVSEGPDQCASAQFEQDIHCPLIESVESLDTTECMNGKQMPGWYFAHVQQDLNLRILRMFEVTFFTWRGPCIFFFFFFFFISSWGRFRVLIGFPLTIVFTHSMISEMWQEGHPPATTARWYCKKDTYIWL